MFFYVTIDALIVVLLFIGELNNSKIKTISDSLIVVLFFIVGALSYKIHNDMYMYQYVFEHIKFSDIGHTLMEPGYALLNVLGSYFFNFPVFKIIIYAINTILIYKGIREIVPKNETVFVMAILYFMAGFYMYYITTFRQAIAIAIFIYSLKYLKNRNTLKYFIAMIFAATFHISALILLFFPLFFKNYKNSLFRDLSLFLLSILLGFTPILDKMVILVFEGISAFIPKITSYAGLLLNENSPFTLNTLLILGLAPIVIILFNTKKNYPTREEKFMYIGFIIMVVMYFVGLRVTMFFRIFLYFYIFIPFMFILFFRRFTKNSYQIVLKYFIVFLLISLFNLLIIFKAYRVDYRYIPYHSYIETFFYDIPYNETAQYKHMIDRYGTSEIHQYQF